MKKIILIIIAFYFAVYSPELYSQYGISSGDKTSIEQQLKSVYSFDYKVEDIVNVDSVENIYNTKFGLINDPYGTLKNCLLFTANIKDASANSNNYSIVGVYKDKQIIWRSDFVIPGYFRYGKIFGTIDLNNNGKVDILTQWQDNSNKDLDLWIYEWDGNNGTIINAYDESGSNIGTSEFTLFDIADFEGDGIWEITGFEPTSLDPASNIPNEYETYVYAWDGIKYKYSRTVEKDPLDMFFPRTKFTAQIKAVIEKSEQGFLKYNYIVKNDLSSTQYINQFDVYTKIDTISNKIKSDVNKPKGWKSYVYYTEISWINEIDNFFYTFTTKYKIKPGTQLDNYSFEAQGLPAIVEVYLRGFNYDLAQGDDSYNRVDDYIHNSVIDTTIGPSNPPSSFIPSSFLDTLLEYNSRSYNLGWVKDSLTANKYYSLFTTTKTQLQQNNITGVKSTLNQVLQDVDIDSTSNLTSEAYALIKYNTEYLLEHLPASNPVSLAVNLENSSNTLIDGGSLQYYDGGWKDAINNNDGTFGINTDKTTLSLRMNYAYGSQTVSNVPAQNNTYSFHTTNVSVQLNDSQGNLIDGGAVKYYAGGWRDFGTIVNGVATKELLPGNYSFRMTYAYGSSDKQQNIGNNPTVVFQTVNANVQLKNSLGNFIDQGTVKYYAGGWRDFGTTTNGTATKELLPNNYSFRMTYAYGSNDKQQNIGDNPTVVFQTVNTNVQLKNSLGNLIPAPLGDQGTVQYYSGGWRDFGTTTNGVAAKELLPNNYSFRMTYEFVSNDKQQNIGTNGTVTFSTVLCTIDVKDSQNQPVDGADIKYYSGGWREIGQTVNGQITKELLPKTLTFRMNHNSVQQDKSQDISANNTVEFNTGE